MEWIILQSNDLHYMSMQPQSPVMPRNGTSNRSHLERFYDLEFNGTDTPNRMYPDVLLFPQNRKGIILQYYSSCIRAMKPEILPAHHFKYHTPRNNYPCLL